MTTIAYKDGIIAYDGFATSGNEITENDFDKMFVVDDAIFFMAGTISDFDNFFAVFLLGEKPTKYNECSAFVLYDKTLYIAAITEVYGFWRRKLNLKKHYAIGSGQQFALSALDLGKTAKEAVQFAGTRDIYTGGLIREYKVEMAKNK